MSSAATAPPPLWQGSCRGRGLALVALLVATDALGLGIAALLTRRWVLLFPALLVVPTAVIVAGFSRLRLVVGTERLTIAAGPWRWPRQSIPLGEITDVEAREIEPRAWGGWGLRLRPGRTAWVLRRGEGLVLQRAGGGVVVVTVDGAAGAAAAVRQGQARDT